MSRLPATGFADLHAHTTASDGSLTPTELVTTAVAAGLCLLAITDHDTVAGVPEGIAAAHAAGIALLPGVEISAEGSRRIERCHLLGLGIDPTDGPLVQTLTTLSENRRQRNAKMVARLQALGVEITLDEIWEHAPPGANLGRPHFAAALVAKGVVANTGEAFQRYLADGAAAYIPKETLSPAEAIALVHGAGGLCFLAHPGLLALDSHETHETRIAGLQEQGLDGIETYYSRYSPAEEERFVRLAHKRGLLTTGGSDFHGSAKPDIALGAVRDGAPLPISLVPETLLARAR